MRADVAGKQQLCEKIIIMFNIIWLDGRSKNPTRNLVERILEEEGFGFSTLEPVTQGTKAGLETELARYRGEERILLIERLIERLLEADGGALEVFVKAWEKLQKAIIPLSQKEREKTLVLYLATLMAARVGEI